VIGLGYVGLPLVLRFLEEGFPVVGLDIDPKKIRKLRGGQSYIHYIDGGRLKKFIRSRQFIPTSDFSRLGQAGAVIVCVPTPLDEMREPDLSYVRATAQSIAQNLAPGQLISLESTTYPGTTKELVLPLLEARGGKAGRDFYLVYSPEREDPGNRDFSTQNIPKVIGGITPKCLAAGKTLYESIVDQVVPVSSTQAAEMVKLYENIFRSVNIALVNELKMLTELMGLDIWEIIAAASTKPFGFKAFYPGPGWGGHCIPIDPFYLSWKARSYSFITKFIELAGEINIGMAQHVVNKVGDALNNDGKSIKNARILVLGVAYKKDIDDPRESPALPIMELLRKKKARVSYHDPHIPKLGPSRRYPWAMESVPLTREAIAKADCILILTDHSSLDYKALTQQARLIVDTRNTIKGKIKGKLVKA
jgi:UDP-N-acetyl-D-glucosamine dehydrogenase